MADTAALVVALSAQLTKFEKDMKGAVDIANKRTKEIEGAFAKMNKQIESQFQGLASSFGAAGTFLGGLGPIGLTVAAGLGAVSIAFASVVKQMDEFVKQAGKLRDASESTGLTIVQLKELAKIGLTVGVSGEEVEKAVIKMTIALDDLKRAGGPLFDTLRKIPGALDAVSRARDSTEAIEALIRAFNSLGTEFERNAFIRQAFGRDPAFGRLFRELAARGGLQEVERQARAANQAINEGLVKSLDDMADEIDLINSKAKDLWGDTFSKLVVEAQRKLADYRLELAKFFNDLVNGPPATRTKVTINPLGGAAPDFPGGVPLPRSKPAGAQPLDVQVRLLNETISALGTAATAQEKFNQARLQAAKDFDSKVLPTEKEYKRVLADIAQQETLTALALRERLGIATEEEIIRSKELQFLRESRDLKLTAIEIERGLTKARKDGRDAYEQQIVAASKLQSVTRTALDATFFKQFDQFAVSTMGNFENSLADIAVGARTLEDAFKNMADSIIRDLIRMTLRLAVTAPLFQALSTAFGAPGVPLSIAPRQHGGPVKPGSPYIVGESGPELFVPKHAGQIVPSNVGKTAAGQGLQVTVNNFTSGDTETKTRREQGPNGEQLIVDVVKRRMANGEFDSVNRGRFGLRTQKVR